jgi:REP element-mobilizing transposase RayT
VSVVARAARKESDTGYYHIMTRGINKEYIFNNDFEKDMILRIFDEKLQQKPENELFRIVAYCIMSNHLHMIVHSEKKALINIMKKVNITYAMSYNRKNNRVGALFQERYKSQVICDEKHLFGAIRYVHNNPLKARMVQDVKDYRWSSIVEYIEKRSYLIDPIEKKLVLDRFHSNDDFLKFHTYEDDREHLELSEEIEEQREHKAQKIVEEYFLEKGINEKRHLRDKDELILRLLKESKLSNRKIAKLVEVSVSTVARMSAQMGGLRGGK